MSHEPFRGIFVIPQSPFHDDGRFDYESLETEIEFCVQAGAHGIVWPVMASQFAVLTHDERKKTARLVLKTVSDRIPVVIGVATVWTESAVELARHAQDHGAAALISLPPWEIKPTPEQAFAYYRALSETVSIPIFIQNAGGKFGMAFSAEQVARTVEELNGVDYVKEEVAPAGQHISQVLAACGGRVKGVFGGAGCKHLLNELDRGAAGNMPACALTDILAQIYDRYAGGDATGARELYNIFLPYANFHSLFGAHLSRELLRRRGVIRSAASRYGADLRMDAHDERELSLILEPLRPYFRVQPPP